MAAQPSPVYLFGAYRLDPEEGALTRSGLPIPLPPKAFQMLVVLVRQSGRIVEKEELLQEVWPGTFVEEGNLTVHMSTLRKALSDGADAGEAACIETVPRRGYRFCVPVEEVWEERPALVFERQVETHIVREEIEDSVSLPLWLNRQLVMAGLGVVLFAGVAFFWRAPLRIAAVAPPPRVLPFASYPGEVERPSFAPDGEKIAFAWTGPAGQNWDIYVRAIGNDPPLRLTDGPGIDKCPAWSPDGRQIAFLREKGDTVGIYTVGALGGVERKLLDVTYGRYFDLDWSPDGRYLAFAEKTDPREPYNSPRSAAIFLLAVDTHEKRQLTFPRDLDWDSRFAFSPDGRTLAFLRHNEDGAALWGVPVDGGAPVRIHDEGNWIGHLAWTTDGGALIFTSEREGGSKLFRIAASGGTPQALPLSEEFAYYPAVSPRENRLAFVRVHSDSDLWQVPLQGSGRPGGKPMPLLATARAEFAPEFSPDGGHIAFYSEGTGRRELWMARVDGSNPIPLTDFHAWATYAPSWSPDGKELAFASTHGPGGSKGGVFALNVESREVRRLTDDPFFLPSWSHDGRRIYLASAPNRGVDGIWKIPATGGERVRVTPQGGLLAQESPDGQSLYYLKFTGGIWKVPVEGGEETAVLPAFGADLLGYWRVAEGGIYYLNRTAQPGPAIEFFEFATGRSHRIAALVGNHSTYAGGLTVSPDRKWLVYSQGHPAANDIMLVENFR